MLDHLGLGQVVVWKLDRLGRNTRHLLELLDDFKSRGIKFRSLRDRIATDPDSEVGGAMAQGSGTGGALQAVMDAARAAAGGAKRSGLAGPVGPAGAGLNQRHSASGALFLPPGRVECFRHAVLCFIINQNADIRSVVDGSDREEALSGAAEAVREAGCRAALLRFDATASMSFGQGAVVAWYSKIEGWETL
ncbi:recombinase family protein [bacterium RCC_150]